MIYVDDMIVTGSDATEIEKLRRNLFIDFEMKDLGRLKYFLGIKVLRSSKGIFISQRKYILDLLAETEMVDCKPVDTPMQINHKLKIVEGATLVDKESCHEDSLKRAPGSGIIFKRNDHLKVEAYTDADWAGNPNDRRSTAGYFTLDGGNLVTWKSKKQKVVALSSAEAEFRGSLKA
ncbi:uncharacterized mitochondrial protein AtMg00810-like [Arachis hypogaea]|uniref:uncharacterized mitochondrial protein AtMg00810-like n=1 Tax=Arachis hypogaea TaxID=3818 RepID=UPI003B20F338